VTEIDGHDMKQIVPAFEAAARVSSKPQLIIAKTVKGKGLDFLENLPGSHSCTLSNEQYDRVMGQLKGTAQE
jgi:transketolase